MSITRYIAEAGLTASTPAVALQRLRNRRIVNRYDGSTVTDNANGITGVDTSANITLSSAISIPTGYNVFVDRTITIQDTFNSNANNTHLSFFNCTIILESTAGNPGPLTVSTGTLNTTAVPSSVNTAQASGRSLNFYGCNLFINSPGGNPFQMFSDFMDSNMTFAQWDGATAGPRIPLPSFVVGSRVINGTFFASETHANAVFEIYGIPDVVEGLDIFRMSLEYTGQAGQGSLMFVEPNFSSPENQRRWRTQSPGGDTLMSSVGFYSPLDNTLANAFTTDNSATAYFRTASGANGGQLYNYYAWRPSFFSDVGLTNAIPAVRVRSTSNMSLNAAARGLNVAESNLSGSFSGTSSTINQTGLATVIVNDFLTDANGVPVADANSRVSTNGGTSFNTGQWYDWMRFSRVNTASATTGGETLATNFNGQDYPNGVVAVPIQRFAANAYNQFAATYEARSYTHDVNTGVITENGTIGTAAGNQPSNVPVLIDDQTTVAAANASIATTTEVAAAALLNSASDKTPQNLHDWMRADWSQYNTDLLVEASGDILNWTNGSVTINSGAGTSAIAANGSAEFFNVSNVVVGADADPIKNLSVTGDLNLNVDWTGGSVGATTLIDADGQTITDATVNGGSGANVLGISRNVTYSGAGSLAINGAATTSTLAATGATTVSAAVSGGSVSGSTVTFSTDDGTSNNAVISSTGKIDLDAGGTYADTTFTNSSQVDPNGGNNTGAVLNNVTLTNVASLGPIGDTTDTTLTWTGSTSTDLHRAHTHTRSTFGAGKNFTCRFDVDFVDCDFDGTLTTVQDINRIRFTGGSISGSVGFGTAASTGINQAGVMEGVAFSGTLTGTGGSTLTMTDCNVTGITLGSSGGTITPSGTTDGAILQAAATASSGAWTINLPVVVINNTWTVPTPSSGRYAIRQSVGGVDSELVAPTDFAAGDTLTGTISDTVFTAGTDSITIFVKYDSVFTAGSIQYYLENAQSFNFSNTQGASHTFGVGAAAVANFAIAEQADVPSNVSFTASADGNNALVEITNSSNASLTLTFNTSIQLIADIANSTAYFNAWYANRGTTMLPIVSYGQGYVANIDAGRITFQSGNLDSGFRLQHTTGNWSNAGADGTIFANSRTGAPEVVSVIAGLALVNPTDLRNALDTSTTAAKVSDIENVAGYLVDGASLGPLVNQYEQTTDYTGNI